MSGGASADCYTFPVTPKLYKASEVCEATGVQPYVLRSWEKEFPGIGLQKSPESTRLYRQSDVDQVLRIKQLVFAEGLTLAGARRRIEGDTPRPTEATEAEIAEVLDALGVDARTRIDIVRQGLRSILEVLSKRAGDATVAQLPRNGSSRPSASSRSSSAVKARPAAKRSAGAKRSAARKPVARKAKRART
jgi:DNA-binding transcriptional MerR regulator